MSTPQMKFKRWDIFDDDEPLNFEDYSRNYNRASKTFSEACMDVSYFGTETNCQAVRPLPSYTTMYPSSNDRRITTVARASVPARTPTHAEDSCSAHGVCDLTEPETSFCIHLACSSLT